MQPLDPTAPTWTPTRKLPGALLLPGITVWSAAVIAAEPWSDERLVLRAGAQYFYIDYGDREGDMFDPGAGLEWQLGRRLSR